MAGSKRPSFLKRQKEQTRLARAAEKREARRARKHNKANAVAAEDQGADPGGEELAPIETDEEAEPGEE